MVTLLFSLLIFQETLPVSENLSIHDISDSVVF